MSFSDAAEILGIIGGVTGPLGLLIAYLTFRRDNARVRVRLLRHLEITQGPDDDKVRAMLASYKAATQDPPMELYLRDPDKRWGSIEVVNVGRRKVIIDKIGWTVKPFSYVLPAGFYTSRGWLPKELDEGGRAMFNVEDSSIANALYVWALDTTGKTYNGIAPGKWWNARLCILKERAHFVRSRTGRAKDADHP